MMPTLTRQQFEEMTFEEFLDWARENIDDVTSEDTLIQFAKDKIDDDSFNVAIHILTAIWENGVPDVEDWRYDYSMGTCETPTPITCKEDLEDLIDFGEEEENDEDNDFDPDGRRSEKPWDYGRHFSEEDEEDD